jgi:hypothetical protein
MAGMLIDFFWNVNFCNIMNVQFMLFPGI